MHRSGLESIEARREAGRALRKEVPRSAHGEWTVSDRDPVTILEKQATTRIPEVVPVRHGRMAESSFAFLRGAAAVMAYDLASSPDIGLHVQACGDAHIRNFGKFATPERNTSFSINDFDETLPAPWEWDVKRLGASLHLVAATQGHSPKVCDEMVATSVRAYRERMAGYASMTTLDLWYDRVDASQVISHFPAEYRSRFERDLRKAVRKGQRRAVTRLTHQRDGELRFLEDPPVVVHFKAAGAEASAVEAVLQNYLDTLNDDRRSLLDRFRLVDVARRVVGVGSVGTRCWVALFEGAAGHPDGDHLVLQIKEAQASVLEPYVGKSVLGHHGRRVSSGQRLMQGETDIFLGWTEAPDSGAQYYVRQLWDRKGRSDLATMDRTALTYHGALCGWALARAHARTGDAVQIASYLGGTDTFDRAIARFSATYAKATEADHAALLAAIADKRIEARTGL